MQIPSQKDLLALGLKTFKATAKLVKASTIASSRTTGKRRSAARRKAGAAATSI
jgi:hypothetical protein